jgi:hypothetical protein
MGPSLLAPSLPRRGSYPAGHQPPMRADDQNAPVEDYRGRCGLMKCCAHCAPLASVLGPRTSLTPDFPGSPTVKATRRVSSGEDATCAAQGAAVSVGARARRAEEWPAPDPAPEHVAGIGAPASYCCFDARVAGKHGVFKSRSKGTGRACYQRRPQEACSGRQRCLEHGDEHRRGGSQAARPCPGCRR